VGREGPNGSSLSSIARVVVQTEVVRTSKEGGVGEGKGFRPRGVMGGERSSRGICGRGQKSWPLLCIGAAKLPDRLSVCAPAYSKGGSVRSPVWRGGGSEVGVGDAKKKRKREDDSLLFSKKSYPFPPVPSHLPDQAEHLCAPKGQSRQGESR